jgi:hypothetical protein
MPGENCRGSSENFRNYLKNRHSTDFGVGPIEYIYVAHGQVLKNKTYIYGLKPLES